MMEIQRTQKQWWAPIWKGLVFDIEAKHYRAMKMAVWLYLYLLLNANRRTGILMRKINTVCKDMGIPRDTAMRWFRTLRHGGYIQTVNTGRSLTIQVTRWKALSGATRMHRLGSENFTFRYGKSPTDGKPPVRGNLLRTRLGPGIVSDANDTKMKINTNKETRRQPGIVASHGFSTIGVSVQQEVFAQELARELNDRAGIRLYRSFAAKYPEWLLRKMLAEVDAMPQERIIKGRGALFNYLVQAYAKGATENPGR